MGSLNSIDVKDWSADHTTASRPDMIQLTMKLASIYDARANDITIKIRMYTAPEDMPLYERRRSAYAG